MRYLVFLFVGLCLVTIACTEMDGAGGVVPLTKEEEQPSCDSCEVPDIWCFKGKSISVVFPEGDFYKEVTFSTPVENDYLLYGGRYTPGVRVSSRYNKEVTITLWADEPGVFWIYLFNPAYVAKISHDFEFFCVYDVGRGGNSCQVLVESGLHSSLTFVWDEPLCDGEIMDDLSMP